MGLWQQGEAHGPGKSLHATTLARAIVSMEEAEPVSPRVLQALPFVATP
jgi:hypothetical protein